MINVTVICRWSAYSKQTRGIKRKIVTKLKKLGLTVDLTKAWIYEGSTGGGGEVNPLENGPVIVANGAINAIGQVIRALGKDHESCIILCDQEIAMGNSKALEWPKNKQVAFWKK